MKRIIKILLIISLVLSLSGCWNRRELNSLAIVMGIGLDETENEDELKMTVQLVDTSSMKSSSKGGGGGSSESNYLNLTGTGANVISILRDFTHQISRKLYIPHNQIIVFGEDLAKSGIRDSMDMFLRDHEARLNVNVLVAKGDAEDIFEAEPQLAKIPMEDISKRIDLQSATSETATLSVLDLMTCLTSETCSAVAPIIEIIENDGKKVSSISGGAVFKDDKLVGELDKTQTRGFLWVMGKVKSGIIKVDVKDQKVNLEIVKADSEITSTIKEDGTIQFKIKIREEGIIASQTGSENMSKEENIKLLQKAAEDLIKEEIQGVIEQAKILDADIFGFGDRINRKDAKKWKTLEKDWDSTFQKIDVQIDVTAKVTAAGRLAQPDYPEES